KNIFEYSNYITFLGDWLRAQPKRGHGLRAQMAAALGRQGVFVSQVLHGDADLSLSQAQVLAEWMQLSASETHFLLLLVEHARADTEKLRAYFRAQIQKVREENLILKKRLGAEVEDIPEADRLRYYSAWYYPALRLLSAIPGYQTRAQMIQRLQLPADVVAAALDFLLQLKLVERQGDRFVISSRDIFLGSESALVSRHHLNWRLRCMQSLERESSSELHYSTAVVISEKDAEKIKRQLLDAIEKNREMVRQSGNDELFCVNVDFFRV
ncbi:MAG: TIGR02147 family protein, partial [Bdellovibrionota bacterium]